MPMAEVGNFCLECLTWLTRYIIFFKSIKLSCLQQHHFYLLGGTINDCKPDLALQGAYVMGCAPSMKISQTSMFPI